MRHGTALTSTVPPRECGWRGAVAGCSGRFASSSTECSDAELRHESDAALSPSATWPTYQYDVANAGHNPDASGPKDGVDMAWRYPACTEAQSGIVVNDGRVSGGGLVVNGRTGERVGGEWDSHASTPTFADGRLYVGAHDLLARDAATGDLDWTFETESDAGGLGSPSVANGTVYVTGQFDDPTLYAVDASEGREDWRFDHDAEIHPHPAVGDGTVYVVDETSTMYAIDAASGDELWYRSPGAEISRATPVLTDDMVVLGSTEGDLLALDLEDGSKLWRRDLGPDPVGPVAVADGILYLPGRADKLLALSTADGHEVWNRSLGADPSGPPVVADDVVYVPAYGTLYAVDASTGDDRWHFDTRAVLFGDVVYQGINGLAVVDDLVYVATATGDIYALAEA